MILCFASDDIHSQYLIFVLIVVALAIFFFLHSLFDLVLGDLSVFYAFYDFYPFFFFNFLTFLSKTRSWQVANENDLAIIGEKRTVHLINLTEGKPLKLAIDRHPPTNKPKYA